MATDIVEPLTDKRFDGPKVTQFSVFVKNRAGQGSGFIAECATTGTSKSFRPTRSIKRRCFPD